MIVEFGLVFMNHIITEDSLESWGILVINKFYKLVHDIAVINSTT
jgi:hypothetical protein